jgi:hypothetical protein
MWAKERREPQAQELQRSDGWKALSPSGREEDMSSQSREQRPVGILIFHKLEIY